MRVVRVVAAVFAAGAALTGCSQATTSPEPAPASASNGAVVGEVPDSLVAEVIPTEFEAEDAGLDTQGITAANAALNWQYARTDGVVQAVACIGSGSPTVVYLDGLQSSAVTSWAQIAVEQSTTNRVCVFDRPAVGLSPMRQDPTLVADPAMHAEEMLSLLEGLNEPAPYVLVGWSYGGLVARAAGMVDPTKVAGLVLVDHTSPQSDWLLEKGLDGKRGVFEAEGILDVGSAAHTVGNGPDLGDRPVIVLQRGDRTLRAGETIDWELEDRVQRAATSLSTNSLHAVVTNSDHAIPIRDPGAVVAATRAVSDSVRAGNSPLPACPSELADAGATCTEQS